MDPVHTVKIFAARSTSFPMRCSRIGSQISGSMPNPPGMKRVSNWWSSLRASASERVGITAMPFFMEVSMPCGESRLWRLASSRVNDHYGG